MFRILLALFLLALVAVGVAFTVLNAKPVELDYFLGTREVPLALTLVLTLAVGVLLGFLFSLGAVVRLKRDVLRLRRQVNLTEQEVSNLRALPIKDTP